VAAATVTVCQGIRPRLVYVRQPIHTVGLVPSSLSRRRQPWSWCMVARLVACHTTMLIGRLHDASNVEE
jgi:hypothetical protein